MTTKTKRINARVTPAEYDILLAVIGTMDTPGREKASESEAIRMLLRQWAADNNYKGDKMNFKEQAARARVDVMNFSAALGRLAELG